MSYHPWWLSSYFSRCHLFHITVFLKQVSCVINLLHSTPYFKINVVLWDSRSYVERSPKNSSHNLTWVTSQTKQNAFGIVYCMDLVRRLVLSVKYYVLEIGSVLETSSLFLIRDDGAIPLSEWFQIRYAIFIITDNCTTTYSCSFVRVQQRSYCHVAVKGLLVAKKQKDAECIKFRWQTKQFPIIRCILRDKIRTSLMSWDLPWTWRQYFFPIRWCPHARLRRGIITHNSHPDYG